MVTGTHNVNASAISPADSSLWIATSARGLVRVGKNGKSFSYSAEKGDFQDNNIVSLTFDNEGILWLKDSQGAVYSYSSFSGFVKQTELPQNIAAALSEPVASEEVQLPEVQESEPVRQDFPWYSVVVTVLLLALLIFCFFRRKKAEKAPESEIAVPSPEVTKSEVIKPETSAVKPTPKPAPKPSEAAPATKPEVTEPLSGSFYEHVYKIIENNYTNAEFGVEDVAAALGMSRVHLNRKLKAENSPSPSDVIKKMRMELAAGMLKDGNRSISEIAKDCGFSSASYFSSAFKDYFGVAPAAFGK